MKYFYFKCDNKDIALLHVSFYLSCLYLIWVLIMLGLNTGQLSAF